jgi:hypothetical protein
MDASRDFYYTLYKTLLANTPVDTGNMLSHITLEDYGEYWKITISGPKGNYDYAQDVNYNPQRTAKERKNYKWVERTVRQVSETIAGSVKYEL